MSRVPLSGDDTAVIFSDAFSGALDGLGHSDVCRVWSRLVTVVENPAPPSHFVYERVTGAETLEVIRVGDDLRIYTKIIEDVPGYNILNVFFVHQHDYGGWQLYDEAAQQRVMELRALETPAEVVDFIEERSGLSEEDIREIYSQICE